MFKFIHIFVVLAALHINACGYQLRGSQASVQGLHKKAVMVTGQSEQLKTVLVQSLLAHKVTVVTVTEQHNETTKIVELKTESTTSSASGYDADGDPVEYRLFYRLELYLDDRLYNFSASERYSYSKNQLLTSEQNRQQVFKVLQQQAVSFILRLLAQ